LRGRIAVTTWFDLFPYGSADWTTWFGIRSIIEGFNSYFKDPA